MDTELNENALTVYKDPQSGRTYKIPDLSDKVDLYKLIQDSTGKGGVPPEVKIQAACLSTVINSVIKIAAILGVSDTSIKNWKQEPWWHVATREARKAKNEELDAELTDLISYSIDQIADRIINGEAVLDKSGNLRRIPVRSRDLTTNFAILFDKRTILRSDPRDKAVSTEVSEHLEKVATKLEKLVGKIPDPVTLEQEAEFVEISPHDE